MRILVGPLTINLKVVNVGLQTNIHRIHSKGFIADRHNHEQTPFHKKENLTCNSGRMYWSEQKKIQALPFEHFLMDN